jgi:hypothetical protein
MRWDNDRNILLVWTNALYRPKSDDTAYFLLSFTLQMLHLIQIAVSRLYTSVPVPRPLPASRPQQKQRIHSTQAD